jgi:mannose/fructose/N-acetylgalactosamine-specific phosphotransferase system component IID
VKRVGGGARLNMLLRSLTIQASWNYRTLLGAGFAFALLPALRALYGDDAERLKDALARHGQLFNSHPYLAPMALGAVAAMEEAGEDPALVERFKQAVRGSLGTLGDRLIWAGWRPVCLLFGMALLLAGTPWWFGVGAFLIIYNAGHLLLRGWSFHLGLTGGKQVGERLRRSPVGQAQQVLSVVGAFLLGLVLPLAATGRIAQTTLGWPWIVAAAVAALVGTRYGAAIRTPLILALAGLALLGLVISGLD